MGKTTNTESIRVARSFKRQLNDEKERLQKSLGEDTRITLIDITDQLTIIPETGQARLRQRKP